MNEENCPFPDITNCDKCNINESCTLSCKEYPVWAQVRLRILRKMMYDE